jgi:putative transport protein
MGHLGRISFFIPHSANMMIRELGIVLFLACVGLISGERFVETLVKGDGLYWMAVAAFITVVPLLVMALIARVVMKLNFMPLCGIMAGSMTDPPALAFANATAGNELPAIAYATVYPLTMILRILTAQLFVILFVGG